MPAPRQVASQAEPGSWLTPPLSPSGTMHVRADLSLPLVFFGKEPDVREPSQREYEKPQDLRGIRNERGNRQRQREERRPCYAAGAQGPDLRAPDARAQQPAPPGCVPPVGRGGGSGQDHRGRV